MSLVSRCSGMRWPGVWAPTDMLGPFPEIQMRTLIAVALALATLALGAGPRPKVKLNTTLGAIVLELEPEAAPKTVGFGLLMLGNPLSLSINRFIFFV